MKILIFGASGKVGRATTSEALERGHEVTAFVHTTPPFDDPRLHIVHGDIYDRQSVEKALDGQDAVISALGSWGTKHKNVLSTAMEKIIPAMEQHGITRIVSLTGNMAGLSGEKVSFSFSAAKAVLGALAPKILRDGEDHLALLTDSSLDWTVVRSPVMTTHGAAHYTLSDTGSLLALTVHREAVARSLVDILSSPAHGAVKRPI